MSKGIFYLIILTVFLLVIWEINEIVTIGFQYTGIKRLIAIFFCFCIILFWKYHMVLAMVLLSILLLAFVCICFVYGQSVFNITFFEMLIIFIYMLTIFIRARKNGK